MIFLVGMLAALAGCANYRDVTFLYYPNAPPSDRFPQASAFYAEADRECAKYGMKAVPVWSTWADFQRIKVIYNCIQ